MSSFCTGLSWVYLRGESYVCKSTDGASRPPSSSHVMWSECMAIAGGMTKQLSGTACILMEPCGVAWAACTAALEINLREG